MWLSEHRCDPKICPAVCHRLIPDVVGFLNICHYFAIKEVKKGGVYLGRLYRGAMRKQATTARFLCLDSSFCQTHFLDRRGCST